MLCRLATGSTDRALPPQPARPAQPSTPTRPGHVMTTRLPFEILAQPDDSSCGATCLHALYRYHGDELPLDQVVAEVPQLEGGGTLEMLLGQHALRRGYSAVIYTYNLRVFDPTWFGPDAPDLTERLLAQEAVKDTPAVQRTSPACREFLALGGEVRFEDLTPALLRRHLKRETPVLAGLSATYLYGCAREVLEQPYYDDVNGLPQGHFVVLCGYQPGDRSVDVADPLQPNPYAPSQHYRVGMDKLICSIMLGVLTHDASLLVIRPPATPRGR